MISAKILVSWLATLALTLVFASAAPFIDSLAWSQSRPVNEELAAIAKAQAANAQRLAKYTWEQMVLITVNGQAQEYLVYGVKIGGDGQLERNLITQDTGNSAAFEPSTKQQKTEYEPFARQLEELAARYTALDSDRLLGAGKRGDVALQRAAGTLTLVIKNYVKPNDFLSMKMDQQTYNLVGAEARSYLTDPKDAVTIKVQFDQLPDGTNHIARAEIDSVNKHLTVKEENSFFTK